MLEIGSVVDGKYKVLNILGKGGMSVVYLVMNEKVNKQWAIKEIIKKDAWTINVDKKEIEMMKKMNHPHLPCIVDVIENEQSLLIVMDYIEGRSLEDIFVEQGAQPVELVLKWAEQLCDVLCYLHTQSPPIIYRDMKPANVMLKPDGNLMLIDFGAAREFKPHNLKDTISLGTCGYAAPEQYLVDGQSDARTDIYCFGVMLFQLLTGANPHELRPIREFKPELSAGLETIIEKCTQIKKEERYQSAEELLYAIQHYWEFDAAYRRKQKKQLGKFMIPMFLTIFMAMGTMIFRFLENDTRKSNYDAYLLAAANSTTKAEEIDNYEKAICLNPERFEGYFGILENGFLDDLRFTTEESRQLRRILMKYGNGQRTNEVVFRENAKEYGEFAYQLGIAYFYKYEEKSNKRNAKGYLEVAANWEELKTKHRERAKRLYIIADYYSRIGMIDAAGDENITYLDYWKDLVALSSGNIVEEDNERTALVMYEEMVSQIVSGTVNFRNAGILQDEILNQLQQMKEHLATDFGNMEKSNVEVLTAEIEQLLEDIGKAEKIVQSVYGQTKEGE